MDNTTDKLSNSARETGNQSGHQFGRADIHSAIDRTAEKVQPTADRLATSAHATVDKMAEKITPTADRLAGAAHTAVDRVADTATSVSARASSGAKQLGAAYTRFAETGRNYVRTSPATSVLIAVAAGYGLSKLLSSRK